MAIPHEAIFLKFFTRNQFKLVETGLEKQMCFSESEVVSERILRVSASAFAMHIYSICLALSLSKFYAF